MPNFYRSPPGFATSRNLVNSCQNLVRFFVQIAIGIWEAQTMPILTFKLQTAKPDSLCAFALLRAFALNQSALSAKSAVRLSAWWSSAKLERTTRFTQNPNSNNLKHLQFFPNPVVMKKLQTLAL
jgi:hypothetical protein